MNPNQKTEETLVNLASTNGAGYSVQLITPWGDTVQSTCPDLCYQIKRIVQEHLISLQAEIREEGKQGIAGNYLREHFMVRPQEPTQAKYPLAGLQRTSEPTEEGIS